MKFKFLIAALVAATSGAAMADTYNIDPSHTFPSFEADHMGLSVWRGKFGKTTGTVKLDRAAKSGALDIVIDAKSIDFGLEAMNAHARKADMFNVEKFPEVTYKSKSLKFDGDRLVSVDGELTLLGVTKPVTLTINKFKCIMHPRLKREVCGADASAEFKRTDFGLGYATPAFSPEVKLAIQVEAIKAE
ncbi:YceI family protein [Pseudoduganella namucuonensis]|uniref:Polyisoprenoid-binding protein YceI n=1 Tax=Pseudoduganella namucuonensis TaxID=1035707 RepID=A0A1I7LAT2_9BURK|nr:YceI family protein [Pseudoduganella namucuonensis]SFV06604.1 Polyisoprenoid-binding protein YceI [Pseudoduganella namucuonensis]